MPREDSPRRHPERSEGSLGAYAPLEDKKESVPREDKKESVPREDKKESVPREDKKESVPREGRDGLSP